MLRPVLPQAWAYVDVNIAPSSGYGATSVIVDLTKTKGIAHGLRYAWEGDCCAGRPPTAAPCNPASCPLMSKQSKLPANPFMARIVGGKCECVPPQVCDN